MRRGNVAFWAFQCNRWRVKPRGTDNGLWLVLWRQRQSGAIILSGMLNNHQGLGKFGNFTTGVAKTLTAAAQAGLGLDF